MPKVVARGLVRELVADLRKIRSKIVGPQLSFKRLAPIAAAGIIVITLGVYGLLHFTRPAGAPGSETGRTGRA